MSHVPTQLPYALTAAFLAIVLGYLTVGHGVSPWWLLATDGVAACWLLVRYWGQRVQGAIPS
jgi:Na+/H+ antiporter NhaC